MSGKHRLNKRRKPAPLPVTPSHRRRVVPQRKPGVTGLMILGGAAVTSLLVGSAPANATGSSVAAPTEAPQLTSPEAAQPEAPAALAPKPVKRYSGDQIQYVSSGHKLDRGFIGKATADRVVRVAADKALKAVSHADRKAASKIKSRAVERHRGHQVAPCDNNRPEFRRHHERLKFIWSGWRRHDAHDDRDRSRHHDARSDRDHHKHDKHDRRHDRRKGHGEHQKSNTSKTA